MKNSRLNTGTVTSGCAPVTCRQLIKPRGEQPPFPNTPGISHSHRLWRTSRCWGRCHDFRGSIDRFGDTLVLALTGSLCIYVSPDALRSVRVQQVRTSKRTPNRKRNDYAVRRSVLSPFERRGFNRIRNEAWRSANPINKFPLVQNFCTPVNLVRLCAKGMLKFRLYSPLLFRASLTHTTGTISYQLHVSSGVYSLSQLEGGSRSHAS